jgi:hypothetical protein
METDERKPDAIERAARAVCMYKTGDPERVGEFRREAQIAVEAAGVPWQPDYAEKLLLERAEAAEQRVRELRLKERDADLEQVLRMVAEIVRTDATREQWFTLSMRGALAAIYAKEEARQAEAKLATAVEALRGIEETRNTRLLCVRHGGDMGADEPDTCNCGIAIDADKKMREIARRALSEIEQGDAK